jgi:predicted aspartyl protease
LPDLTAVIDTGVSETAIDLRLARRLGLSMSSDSADFVTGRGVVQGVSIPDLRLGPLQIDSLSGIAVDLSGMERDFGIRPDLLIGMDLLHRANFTIDYKAQQLTFGAVSSLAHKAQLLLDSRFALVEAMVERKTVRLQIDTGLNGFLIYANRAPIRAELQEIGAHIISITQSLRVQTADVSLEIGDWHMRNMAVSVIERGSAPTHFDGLLGGRALAHRKLAFDFDRMMVWWE